MRPSASSTRDPDGLDSWPTYEGLWPCRVVSIDDPEKLGRIKCRIFQLHGSENHVPDKFLPWITPLFSLAGFKHGVFALPEVGSDGWVAFNLGNYRFPIFVGEHYGAPKGTSDLADEFYEDYPNTRGYKDPAGFKVLFNATKKVLTIEDAHGNLIRLTADGDGGFEIKAEDPFEIRAVKVLNVVAEDDLGVSVKKNLSVEIKGDSEVTLVGKSKVIAKNDVEVDAHQDVKVSSRNGDIVLDARVRDIKLKARNITFDTTGDVRFNAGGRVILDQ